MKFKKLNTNKLKKERGITLIALVVTIVVLLILATISISLLTGENGIIKHVQDAKKETNESSEEERVNLAVTAARAEVTPKGERLTTDIVKNNIGLEFGESAKDKVSGSGPWTYKGEYKDYIIDEYGNITGTNNSDETVDVIVGEISELLKPGDFIQYDAGRWTQTEINNLIAAGHYVDSDLPGDEETYKFGGFGVNDDRNLSIFVSLGSNSELDLTQNPDFQKGWKVLSNKDGVIKIISAGTVEAYRHSQYTPVQGFPSGGISEFILRNAKPSSSQDSEHTLQDYINTGILPRDFTMYENELAQSNSAHCCNLMEAYNLTNSLAATDNKLRNIGTFYHLASCQEKAALARVEPAGNIFMSGNTCQGIRIVITLKNNVKIDPRNTGDGSSYNNAWKLTL